MNTFINYVVATKMNKVFEKTKCLPGFLLRHRRCGSDFLIHNIEFLAFIGTIKRRAFPAAKTTLRGFLSPLQIRTGVHAVMRLSCVE